MQDRFERHERWLDKLDKLNPKRAGVLAGGVVRIALARIGGR